MVLNQSNLMYLPAGRIIAAGTDKRNLMQAGLQKTREQEIDERIDYLTYKIDKLLQSEQNLKQVGVAKQVSLEEQRALKQAAILNNATKEQVFETFRAFSNNEDVQFDVPRRKNVMQTGIRQASIRRQPPSDYEMLQTFREFGQF
jgi:hypothetical protein